MGDESRPGGRIGDDAANRLADRMSELNLPLGRLKTGTPPRLNGKTINWNDVDIQPGDDQPTLFSFLSTDPPAEQVSCGVTFTNNETHQIIADNLERSAMYGGHIDGTGPRYCPSIEDKVVRFREKSAHQIFLEPESLSNSTIYPNGISTSLPVEVQKSEPYRMFTSRAEFRLTLRADNADQRLTPLGIEIGCVDKNRSEVFSRKMEEIERTSSRLSNLTVTPNEADSSGVSIKKDGVRLWRYSWSFR